jgi:hypothetical protein
MDQHPHNVQAVPNMSADYDYLSDVFTYHPPKSESQILKFEAIRNAGFELADLIRKVVPGSRESDNAIDAVRVAVMWANAALAIHDSTPEDVPEEVLRFFGNLSPENARAIKAALQDEGLHWDDNYNWVPGGPAYAPSARQDAKEERVSQSDHDVTFGPQNHEETLPDHPNVGDDHPGMTCEEYDRYLAAQNQPVEGVLTDEERIGTLQFMHLSTGEQVCRGCSGDVTIVESTMEAVCLQCGRTCLVSNAEAETPDEKPGCLECGMIGSHTHIDDKTFLDDGTEIRVLSGMKGFMEHYGLEGVPYVAVEDEQVEQSVVPQPRDPEMNLSIQVADDGVSLDQVSTLVQRYLESNPNALFEPIGKVKSNVADWIQRGRDLAKPVQTFAEQQSHIRKDEQ